MPNKLGDSFPDELRQLITEHSLGAGSVIRKFVLNTNPPKIKRFIILAISPSEISLASVFINSEININVFRTDELKKLQVPLEASERGYLDHDSYVDCSRLYEKDFKELKNYLDSNPNEHLGMISKNDLGTLIAKVRKANTISKSIKRKYGWE